MASATCVLSVCCCSSCVRSSKPTMNTLSSSLHSCPKVKTLKFSLSSRFSKMGMGHFSPWNGLRYVGISISAKPQKLGRREKCKGKVVYASLFGIGAPEALVIGAVALMVFGPKGLAEVARSLGKTLREFQPAIKELQEVSREFKNSLEREISLDDDLSAVRNTNGSTGSNLASTQSISGSDNSQTSPAADTNGAPPNSAYSSEQNSDMTEEQLSSTAHQDATSLPPESQIEIESQPQDGVLLDIANFSEDNLKISDKQQTVAAATQQDVASSPEESQTETESQPQGAVQETAMAASADPET